MNGGSHRDGVAIGDRPADVRQQQAPIREQNLVTGDGRTAGFESPFVASRVAKFGDARCADAGYNVYGAAGAAAAMLRVASGDEGPWHALGMMHANMEDCDPRNDTGFCTVRFL
jgi:hypothetical protein